MATPEERVRSWAARRLSDLLQMPPEDLGEIVENIMAYDQPADLKEFLSAFADPSAAQKVNAFVESLFEWRAGESGRPAKTGPKQVEPEANGAAAGGAGGGRGKGKGAGRGDSGGKSGRGRGDDGKSGKARGRDAGTKEGGESSTLLMQMLPKKQDDKRLMIIDSASGRHKILTNCLNCGKVIAEDEGWGPCLFCGNPLERGDQFGTRHGDERGVSFGGGDSAEKSAQAEEEFNKSFEKACARKDALIGFDHDSKKRTKVFDDATDWYSESVNPWLNERQREDAAKNAKEEERRKEESRRRVHAKIDIFGRTIIDATAEVEAAAQEKNKDKLQTWTEEVAEKSKLLNMYEEQHKGMGSSQLSGDSKNLFDRLRASLHSAGKKLDRQKAENSDWGDDTTGWDAAGKKGKARWDVSNEMDRVGNEFSALSTNDFTSAGEATAASTQMLAIEESPYDDDGDGGQCITMHQPWASLLVHGFKRAEGRMWKAEYRGRLWIHAAAKDPEENEIQSLEQTYRDLYAIHGVPIPPLPSEGSGYPTSALLGCVDMENCWSNVEYTAILKADPKRPQEQNDDDYIFDCLRPRRLIVPVKMSGTYKIWQIPKGSLQPAQRGLRPARWPAPEGYVPPAKSSLPAPPKKASGPSGGGSPAATGSAGAAAGAARVETRPTGPRFDLWPSEKPAESLHIKEKDRDADRDVVVLQNGFTQLVGFVPPDMQQRIVDLLREDGLKCFAAEAYDGIKKTVGVARMYLGMRWDEAQRGYVSGGVPELAKLFADMYSEAVKRANRELKTPQNKKRKFAPLPEGRAPNVGVVNLYEPGGKMEEHTDHGESKESMNAGFPVMGICLGDACDFAYGNDAPNSSRKPKTLRLESGDVYLFGGESRLMWHGVTKIVPRTAPPSLRLVPGRLSITLRVA